MYAELGTYSIRLIYSLRFRVGYVPLSRPALDPIFMLGAPIMWGHDPNFSQVVWTVE